MRRSALLLVVALGCARPEVPREEGRPEIRFPTTSAIEDVHPGMALQTASLVGDLVFDSLTVLEGEVARPELALDWESSAEATRWTLRIRADARFHDGRPLTARDCAATLNQLARAGHHEIPASFREASADGDHRLLVHLTRPDPRLPAGLAHIPITAEGAEPPPPGERPPWIAPGTGPYRVVEASRERLVLEATGTHFRYPKPAVRRVEFFRVGSIREAWVRLMRGQGDVFPVLPGRHTSFLKQAGFSTWVTPTRRLLALVPNLDRAPFHNPLVRRALSLSLDRAAIVEAADGLGRPSASVIPTDLIPADPPRYAPREALAVFERLPGGHRADLLFAVEFDDHARIALAVSAQLFAVGFEVEPRVLPAAQLIQQVMEGRFDLALVPRGLHRLDWIRQNFSTGGPLNVSRYRNPHVDRLLEEVLTADSARSQLALAQAKKILDDELPIIPLFWQETLSAVHGRFNVSGVNLAYFCRGIPSWTLASPPAVASR